MPVRQMMFYTESQITATDPLNSSGQAAYGALFENTDDGNQNFDGGPGGTPGTFSIAGKPSILAVDDDDAVFNDDSTMLFDPQLLAEPVAGWGAGSNVEILYSYTVSGSDGSTLTVYAIGAGTDYLNDDFIGLVTSAPLVEGVTYTVTAYDPLINIEYSSLQGPLCFTDGTLIETEHGPRAVETLRSGDKVRTLDGRLTPIQWIGRTQLGAARLLAEPNLHPIRIRAGALGDGTPSTDLVVSPQHRVLVRSRVAQRMFGQAEVLLPAKHLTTLDGIDVATDMTDFAYIHLLFDQHEIVISNGAATESLYPGPQALKSVGAEGLAEILNLFPELTSTTQARPHPARLMPEGKRGKKLVERLAKNNRPVIEQALPMHA